MSSARSTAGTRRGISDRPIFQTLSDRSSLVCAQSSATGRGCQPFPDRFATCQGRTTGQQHGPPPEYQEDEHAHQDVPERVRCSSSTPENDQGAVTASAVGLLLRSCSTRMTRSRNRSSVFSARGTGYRHADPLRNPGVHPRKSVLRCYQHPDRNCGNTGRSVNAVPKAGACLLPRVSREEQRDRSWRREDPSSALTRFDRPASGRSTKSDLVLQCSSHPGSTNSKSHPPLVFQ